MNASESAIAAAPTVLGAAAALDDAAREVEIKTETTPGLLTRTSAAMERNPIKSSVGIAAGLGLAAFAGYNYYDHGSLLPVGTQVDGDTVVETANAVSSLMGSLFGL